MPGRCETRCGLHLRLTIRSKGGQRPGVFTLGRIGKPTMLNLLPVSPPSRKGCVVCCGDDGPLGCETRCHLHRRALVNGASEQRSEMLALGRMGQLMMLILFPVRPTRSEDCVA